MVKADKKASPPKKLAAKKMVPTKKTAAKPKAAKPGASPQKQVAAKAKAAPKKLAAKPKAAASKPAAAKPAAKPKVAASKPAAKCKAPPSQSPAKKAVSPAKQPTRPLDVWACELEAKAAELGRTADHLLQVGPFPRVDDKDGGPSLDQLRQVDMVVLPRPVKGVYTRIKRRLESVGYRGSARDVYFRMVGTSDSYEGHDIIKKHLTEIDKLLKKKDWPQALTHLAALVRASTVEDFWFQDTDMPEEVEEIIEKMGEQWDTLWACSNAALGGVTAAERDMLEAAFERLKDEIRGYSIDV